MLLKTLIPVTLEHLLYFHMVFSSVHLETSQKQHFSKILKPVTVEQLIPGKSLKFYTLLRGKCAETKLLSDSFSIQRSLK